MSLLLDALKKAAQEKQQASSTAEGEENSPQKDEELELSLEEHPGEEKDGDEAQTDISNVEQPPEEQAKQTEEDLSIEVPLEMEKASATTSTISDEALELLVYKTNKQHRRKQKIIWGGTLFASVVLLVLGGVYYYYVMVEEVEALERKHRIAMRQLDPLPSEVPKKRPVIENFITEPEQKVVAKKNTAATVSSAPKKQAKASSPSAEVFSVQRSRKNDPVSVLLNKGWQAYGKANYKVASDAYKKVLAREANNRDALLGMAAIAVKQGDFEQARSFYNQLIKLDPRDQIAVSALSNLEEVSAGSLGESKLKFMIQQQPDSAHLHFALGNHYAKQGNWPEAQSEYFSAWQGDSENPDYAFNLAVSLDQLGKQDQAKRFYEKCLTLSVGKNISFSTEAVKDRLTRIAAR